MYWYYVLEPCVFQLIIKDIFSMILSLLWVQKGSMQSWEETPVKFCFVWVCVSVCFPSMKNWVLMWLTPHPWECQMSSFLTFYNNKSFCDANYQWEELFSFVSVIPPPCSMGRPWFLPLYLPTAVGLQLIAVAFQNSVKPPGLPWRPLESVLSVVVRHVYTCIPCFVTCKDGILIIFCYCFQSI